MPSSEQLSPVKQVLIAAGGFGTRMDPQLNPDHCKALINIEGQPILGWLLDALQEGGISRFLVASNYHSDEAVRRILAEKGIDEDVSVMAPEGFRAIPYQVREQLDDRFLMVCGHHALNAQHVRSLLDASEVSEHVITAYNNAEYTMDKENRIIVDDVTSATPSFAYRNITDGSYINPEHYYIRNPYVTTKGIAAETQADDFKYTFSYYLLNRWRRGESLAVVETPGMPPEFDYENEFELSRKFIAQLALEHQSLTGST